jgi:hypothetical protein
MFSPIDSRTLTPAQCGSDIDGLIFSIGRAKTGKAAAGTLTQWSQAILLAYLRNFGADILETSPLFRTRGGKPVSRKGKTGQWGGDHGGGTHVLPKPYTKDSLVNDFGKVRTLAFGPDETRQLADMRRSGAVEGDTGGSTVEDQSNKMANTVSRNTRLRKTYNPVNIPSVRRFDEHRAKGAKILEQKPDKSISSPALEILLRKRKPANPLK